MYNNNNDGEEEDRIENLKTEKQKQGVTRKKEEKRKIREKNGKTEKEKEREKESQFHRHAPISYFPPSLSKSYPLPKTKKGVPLGTNHSGLLPSKSLISMTGFLSYEINCVEKRCSSLFGFESRRLD